MNYKKPIYIPPGQSVNTNAYVVAGNNKPNYKLHLLLFIITFWSTTIAGIRISGHAVNVPLLKMMFNPDFILNPHYLSKALPFSLTLMLILSMHEMGHYVASRIHKVEATLPYFVPAPTLIGTFGAFIKMKSPIYDKRALLDIGAAGPIAGFIVSIPAVILGLHLSEISAAPKMLGSSHIHIGSSMLIFILSKIFAQTPPQGFDLVIHPIGFAGWLGLFVTSLNLIPVGQLDGGHVAYAVLGRKYEKMANMILVFLVVIGVFFWMGWFIWAIIIFFMGRKHPPSLNPYLELDPIRKIVAWVVLAIFFLTFIPVPFMFSY